MSGKLTQLACFYHQFAQFVSKYGAVISIDERCFPLQVSRDAGVSEKLLYNVSKCLSPTTFHIPIAVIPEGAQLFGFQNLCNWLLPITVELCQNL